jgi:transcription initiation factor TFIIB
MSLNTMEESIWNIFSPEKDISKIELESSSACCPECNSCDLIAENGHSICTQCGTDIGPILEGDDGSIFHDQSKSGNTHRLSGSANALLQRSSLGTNIGPGSYRFQSMMRYHKYNSMPYKERSQWKIFKKIRSACEIVYLPKSIIQEAQRLYKKVADDCSARGNHRKGLIASCVFYACKYEGVPRTTKEVAKLFTIQV